MLFNDILFLEVFLIINALYFILSVNLLTLLYTSGIFLILSGALALINDMDIYIGFLWIIDLGVGLIFFIFILHFSSFLHQKSQIILNSRLLILNILLILVLVIFYYYNSLTIGNYQNLNILKL